MPKLLPVFFPPVSNCYSACSGVASILQAYDIHNPALFLNRLFLFRKTNQVLKYAMLEKTNESFLIYAKGENICDILMRNLDNNDYIFIDLDHYYLSTGSCFHLHHFVHDHTLVYGYDSERQMFYCADNFISGKYSHAEVPFAELESAWNNIPDVDNIPIVIFRYNESVYNDHLDYSKIKMVMQDYVNGCYDNVIKLNPTFLSDNIFGFHNGQNSTYETCVFGIKIYDWLWDYLKNAERLDVRPLHLLMNHQEILLCMLEYMQQYKTIDKMHKYIEILNRQAKDCQIARNLALKYNMQQDVNTCDRISNIIAKVHEQESLFFEEILSDEQIW